MPFTALAFSMTARSNSLMGTPTKEFAVYIKSDHTEPRESK